MRAGIISEPGIIKQELTDIPEIGSDEVLVRVKYCGICGTDVHIFNGVYSRDIMPFIPGHEFIGWVEEYGSDVKGWQKGDLVTADINTSCGSCGFCLQSKPLLCSGVKQIGIHRDGAFAEYVSVPARNLFRLNPETPLEKLALIEPVSCCVRTHRASGLSFARSVVVVGGGVMGLLHVQMARLLGAAPVIMVARRQQTLDLAASFGADYTVLYGDGDIDKCRELTGGFGADFVIESVGLMETYEKSMQMLGPGGKLVAFGLAEEGQTASWEPFRTVMWEQSVTGAVAGAGTDVLEAARLIEYNRLDLEHYSGTVLPLSEITRGFELFMKDSSVLKVLIDMEQPK